MTRRTLDSRAAGWIRKVRSTVPPRPRLQIIPERCALLVVDMLRYFAAPDGRCFLPAASAITPRIGYLLASWREQGGVVIFTQHCHTGRRDLGMLGRFFSDYIRAGEPEADIIPALAPIDGEPVIRKTTYDAFLGTPLEAMLKENGCDQLLVTGVLTHMCCETTARAAFCRGFEVYLPADGLASSCEEKHLNSLLAMADAVAVVLSTEEIHERCARNG